MAAHPDQPLLTPQFCFSTVVLRDFLRASRAVDDTITQHLNALVTPSRAGFDPTSTAHRSSAAPPAALARGLSPSQSACRAFRDAVLFPAWQGRDDVIQYCTAVAEDAVATNAALEAAALNAAPSAATDDASPAAASARPDPRLTERYDPYIRRKQFAQVEPQADLLAILMRQEQGVETIIRSRSWDVLQSRCGSETVAGSPSDPSWQLALERWRRREGR